MAFPRPNKDSDWKEQALCSALDITEIDKIFFPTIKTKNQINWAPAREICRQCPVKRKCLSEAVNSTPPIKEGMWGGLSPKERANLIREHNAK
jgi:hypothetical protein